MRLAPPLAAALATLLFAAACDDDAGEPAGVVGEPGGVADDGQDLEDLPPGDDLFQATEGDPGIRTVLHDVDGEEVGTVVFTEAANGVFVEARFRGLEPGFHGFHLHEEPVCDPDAAEGPFTSAGEHWAVEGTDHGEHTGDLPPLLVNEDGTAYLAFQTSAFWIDELRDGPEGTVAVLVHADPDNLGHIPDRYTADGAVSPGPDEDTLATGDAGDRIACGVPDVGDDTEQGDTEQDTEDDADAGTDEDEAEED
jgi:superoxide dismutase, Cu-Zn family